MSESGALDQGRPLWERVMVNAHQLYCPGCRRFRKQMRSLAAALSRLRSGREASDKLPGLFLPPEDRERIKAVMRGASRRNGPGLPRAPSD
jgi:predicted anti-sigma-YlaC factor YlaD